MSGRRGGAPRALGQLLGQVSSRTHRGSDGRFVTRPACPSLVAGVLPSTAQSPAGLCRLSASAIREPQWILARTVWSSLPLLVRVRDVEPWKLLVSSAAVGLDREWVDRGDILGWEPAAEGRRPGGGR